MAVGKTCIAIEDFKKEMSGVANYPKNFVIGSTTNPGDCREFRNALPPSVKVFYNPEFIAQGSIVKNLNVLSCLDIRAEPGMAS